MRVLTDYELNLVCGGTSSSETIVVTGTRYSYDVIDASWFEVEIGGGGGGSGDPGADQPPDEASIDVDVKFDRPLTQSETIALENLKQSIDQITRAINALPDNAILRLPNGADVTGAELKAIWAKTDFEIYDNKTFDNGTNGGEAEMYFGEPTISFNIQYLDQYDNFVGGMNYLVAHELGHLSQAGTSYYTDQTTANDIARALLNGADLDYLDDPSRYTPGAPTEFSVPTTSGGGGSAGGGGGGGYGGGGGSGGGQIP